MQICPVPDALAPNAEAIFRSEGAKQGIEFEEDGDAVLKRSGVTDNYFRVGLPDGSTIVHIIKPGTPFSLQFGRSVVFCFVSDRSRGVPTSARAPRPYLFHES